MSLDIFDSPEAMAAFSAFYDKAGNELEAGFRHVSNALRTSESLDSPEVHRAKRMGVFYYFVLSTLRSAAVVGANDAKALFEQALKTLKEKGDEAEKAMALGILVSLDKDDKRLAALVARVVGNMKTS